MPFAFVCKSNDEYILDQIIALVDKGLSEDEFLRQRDALLESYGMDLLKAGYEKARILINTYCKSVQYAKNYRVDMDGIGMDSIMRAAKYYVPNPYSSFETYASSWIFETLRTFLIPYSPAALDFLIAHRDFVPTLGNDSFSLNGMRIACVEDTEGDEFPIVSLVRDAILSLNKREAFVIVHLFELFGRKKFSMRELARLLDTTTRQIFNISKRAKKKMRERLSSIMELDLLKA